MKFPINSKVKAHLTSIHKGYSGTVLNNDGAFLTVQCDPDKPNPAAYKSKLYPGVTVFQLDCRLAQRVKDIK